MEEMISLSKIIKPRGAIRLDTSTKVIGVRSLSFIANDENSDNSIESEVRQQLMTKYQAEAENILEQSKAEAEIIKEKIAEEKRQWELERQEYRKQAEREGFEEGLLKGQSEGFSQFKEKIEEAKQIVDLSKIELAKYIENSEKNILDIAMTVAEKILKQTLTESPESFLPIVKAVLKEAIEFKEVNLHVYPSQYSLIMNQKIELDAIFPNDTKLYVYPDEDLKEFQCYIESDYGRIDASIDSQLTELKQKLGEFIEDELN